MKIQIKNESGYLHDAVRRLVSSGLNGASGVAHRTKGFTAKVLVVSSRSRVTIHRGGRKNCKAHITLALPRPTNGQLLADDSLLTAWRFLRWAGLNFARVPVDDRSEDQNTYCGPIPTKAYDSLAGSMRLSLLPTQRSPDAKLAAHQKKIERAQAMVDKLELQHTRLGMRIQKWKRKRIALQASTHRIGKPAGTRAPKTITKEELAKLDQAFED